MSDPVLLEMLGICKSFPGVRALDGVDLDLRAGEVLALLGENGAGKSTLIRILSGACRPDGGRIRMHGRELGIRSPLDARRAGISVIHQEFAQVPSLSAAENVFLGRESGPWLRRAEEERRAAELFGRLGVPVPPAALCRDLSVAQQQIVEIAKALAADARVLVMDEPTAALTPREAASLFAVIRELRGRGWGIIYISHRLDEIDEIADRIRILRDGRPAGPVLAGRVERARLIEGMVGRRLDGEFPRRATVPGRARLEVVGLRGGKVRDVSFTIRAGEILGLTGLVGAGRTETARLLFGADRAQGGTVRLDGRLLEIASPRDAIRAGLALLTEDRKGQGLVLSHSVTDNFALPNLGSWSRLGVVDFRKARRALQGHAGALRLKAADVDGPAGALSGGSQQKLVLAKWLERDGEVVIFDEPTRGIDVGAKVEIYRLMNDLAARGKAVLMISSELPEVLGMSDRILVMHDGRVTGEIRDVASATQGQILTLAVG